MKGFKFGFQQPNLAVLAQIQNQNSSVFYLPDIKLLDLWVR